MTAKKINKFPEGNQLWKLRKSHGRPKKFKTPGALWNKATKYFDWCEANPLYEEVLVTNRGDYQRVKVARMRPMTIRGLCLHLGTTHKTWNDYRKDPEYADVCDSIDSVIYEQKFTGAAANLLNPSIIARDLALKDQQEHTVRGGGPVETRLLDKEQYIKIREQMLKEDDC